ncbi:MAG TPA: type VII secretion integral membrane protein EccD [Pseudonocardia sp.]|nr:type VII secretion integral membrane protein EccD [Pseudonocardia sp.]
MATASRADNLCRLTIVTDSGSLDVALPTNVPLVELLPGLVAKVGDPRISAAGAVLQRWGDDPLDENRTPSTLGLLDGETLFLRPRPEAIPPAEFDDLVDAITSTTGLPAHRWRAANTVALMRSVAAVPLLLVVAGLLLPGHPLARQIAALVAVLLTAAFAIAAGKGFGDRVASLVLVAASVVLAGVGGALVQAGGTAAEGSFLTWILTPTAALAGGIGMACAALLLLAVLTETIALLVPAALFGGLLALFGGLAVGTGAGVAGAAALVLVLSLVLTVAAPMVAFRLARLQLPPLPDEVEDLDVGIAPLPGREVVEQIRLADRCVTGLLYALSAASVLAATVLVAQPGWAPAALVVLAAALQLVRTRLLRGVVQRLAVLVSGVHIGSLAVLRGLAELPPAVAVALAVVLFLGIALAMLASARWISTRILPPYWGRAAEIVEWLTCAALLPIAAVPLGLYGWALGIGG